MDIVVSRDAKLGAVADWGAGARHCAVGHGGIGEKLREGDGITPAGKFVLRRVLYRPDRVSQPRTMLPLAEISATDGWCDDPADPAYNRPVRFPHDAGAETLWRDDALYDVLATIGFNDDPVIPGKGSAIFLHVAHPDYRPTEGCIALSFCDLLEALNAVAPGDSIHVRG
jgi:L,D-peptidoglycan transpeptidase YkuD (ErfK/YbiS/YcfS/YnhG family)